MTTTHSADSFASTGANTLAAVRSRRHSTPSWLKLIQEAVETADFGTIQIKVHAGEVVQIETTRKIRVPAESSRFFHPTASAEDPQ